MPLGPETSFLLASVALESPTFAQKTLFPTIKTETQVDPENLRLIFEFLKTIMAAKKQNVIFQSADAG